MLEDVRDIAGGDLTDFAKNSENLSALTDQAAARANLGLGNVDNTSDLDKPVSTAVAAALATKLDVSTANTAFADISSQLGQKANLEHTHPWSAVTGKPAQATRWPAWGEVTGKPTAFPAETHMHSWGEVTGVPEQATRWPAWGEVTGKPATFPPSSHTHPVSQISGLGNAATRNITISSAAPSGGADGDIWFKV